jgi:hypothetical protein
VRLCEIDHSRGGDPRAWRGCGGLLTPAAGPGLPNKQAFQIQKLMGKDGSVSMELNDESEVYHLRDAVWKTAGMAPFDGCYASAVSKSGSVVNCGGQILIPAILSIVCQEHRD